MSGLDDGYVLRQYPGSPSGRFRRASQRSSRLIEGIRTDDEFFRSANCHMSVLDHGLDSIEGDYPEKYKKLLAREKLMFQALIRRAVKKARQLDPHMAVPPAGDIVKPPVEAYNTLPEILPTAREVYKGRLSRLLVVKIANFITKQSFEAEILTVIRQLKVLNELYSTEIPLLLVSSYYNNDFVEMVANKYSDRKLTIHVVKQPLFPLASVITHDPNQSFAPKDSIRSDDFAAQSPSTAPLPNQHYFCVARKKIIEEQAPLPDWYSPGEVFTLCEQVKRHFAANEKDHILLLNSGNVENVVDLKILNYLCQHEGQRIDVCFEVIKPRESDLSNDCDFLVKSGERLKILHKNSLMASGYNIPIDGLMLTKNMWINIPFLRTEESDSILLKLAVAKELVVERRVEIRLEMTIGGLIESQGAFCAAIEVPAMRVIPGGHLGWLWDKINPSCIQKYHLKKVFTYVVFSFIYHGLIYFMTGSLHEWYVKSDKSKAERDGRQDRALESEREQERELNMFWIENSIWLFLVFVYFSVLTYQRRKMSHRSRSPQQRDRRSCADFAQAMLLGTTRFLYAGLNKTAEVNEWCGNDAWLYLLLLHFASFMLEVVGSILVMLFIDPPNVMEPLETA